MSDNQFSTITPKLEEAIDVALDRLGSFEEETEDYSKTLTQVERLTKIRLSLEPEAPAPKTEEKRERGRIEPWIPVIGSVASIILVGVIEVSGHSFASKAAGFINRMK